ncbi:hypothetical protein OEZ86_012102 [Tetradesmus obliquus]|nr:hypothetical protein OEZ86_012102 [Tetradesmus obliquus]
MHPQVYKYYNHLQVGVRNDMVQELWRQQCKVEKVTQQLLDASDYEESSRIKKRAYGQRTGCCCVALTQARAKHAHIF